MKLPALLLIAPALVKKVIYRIKSIFGPDELVPTLVMTENELRILYRSI